MKRITFSQDLAYDVCSTLDGKNYDSLFLLTDSTVDRLYHNCVLGMLDRYDVKCIVINEGDENKNLNSLAQVWKALSDGGASRHSCMINLGGGMITDLGGLAASTFKRGIDFINIPTTLLSVIDASVGGKTGINFNNLKNEIGVFAEAENVIINTFFLRSLDRENILSGYAEMLKHALIDSDAMWAETLNFDIESCANESQFSDMIRRSVEVKKRIVAEDPHEKGIRKILNLGHTFGHAFESLSHIKDCPVLHGYAVAYGLVCELYLSCVLLNFPTHKMRATAQYIRSHYGTFNFTCKDYDQLLELMQHDKKNAGGIINFSLLNDIGSPAINCHATKDDILEAFDFLREGI